MVAISRTQSHSIAPTCEQSQRVCRAMSLTVAQWRMPRVARAVSSAVSSVVKMAASEPVGSP